MDLPFLLISLLLREALFLPLRFQSIAAMAVPV